jgi:AcrR family transcriptional regulator
MQGRARRPRLTRERVLQTALAILDREGVDALGMRRIAEELGVTAMALYKHVPGKRAVEQGITELLASELELPPATLRSWSERLRACARTVRRGCLAHPNAVPLIERAEQPSTLLLRVMDTALRALADAGFDDRQALDAYCTLLGFTMGHVGYQLRGPQQPLDATASVALSSYPAASRALAVRNWSFDDAFEFGLDTIIAGLKSRLRASKR